MSVTAPKALPRADGDFYQIIPTISEEDQALVHRVRAFMESEVTPIINHYWTREEFPHQLIPGLAALGIVGTSYHGYGCPGKSSLLDGILMMELAAGDSSIATFSDVTVIWARDVADNQVKGFLVEKGTPGFKPEKLKDKIALRVVQNALITLEECRVPETSRLQNANSFRDTAAVLRMTRAGVAWEAVGCARGAYELALRYAQERQQFGRPIGRFQLVQDLLVRMLGNITASASMVTRLSHMQDAGIMKDEHASLAKAFCTVKMRETVGYARELLAGNGILLDHHVGRFVADAEAIYSYEGTREMNTLIVGKAITGFSAFV